MGGNRDITKQNTEKLPEQISTEQIYYINMIAILEDLQDQYMTELIPNLRHGMKKMLNNASKHTKRFIKECDSIILETTDFGDTADELRELIETNIKIWDKTKTH